MAFIIPRKEIELTITHSTASPFDAIAKRRPDGAEYWSARDLMPLMGYPRWLEFRPVIERAQQAALNQGHVVDDLFRVNPEKSGGRPREDIYMVRFAAYLVAMNGDPRKPEVAAAQAYFAVQTRIAETQTPAFDLTTLDGISAVLDAGKAALNRAIAAETRADKAETTVREIEGADGLTPTKFHKKYFSAVPEREFFNTLYRLGLLIDQRGTRVNAKGEKRDGYEHGHPSYKGKPFFYLHSRLDRDKKRRESTRVRPGRHELELRDHLASKGLPANQSDIKEIEA